MWEIHSISKRWKNWLKIAFFTFVVGWSLGQSWYVTKEYPIKTSFLIVFLSQTDSDSTAMSGWMSKMNSSFQSGLRLLLTCLVFLLLPPTSIMQYGSLVWKVSLFWRFRPFKTCTFSFPLPILISCGWALLFSVFYVQEEEKVHKQYFYLHTYKY